MFPANIIPLITRSYPQVIILLSLCFHLIASDSFAQSKSPEEIKQLITKYKADAKGPYKAIRWFCPDGTTLPPDQRCPDKGGVQRGQYKDDVVSLALSNNVFIGQILAATSKEDFWNEKNFYSRIKQYQIEKYLRAVDDGWVIRKAQFYRGAMQAENEEDWGVEFYTWLLADDQKVIKEFFLIRESLKDIPHKGDDNRAQKIRTVSRNISDTVSSFMDIRIKIHGQPDSSDIQLVKNYKAKNKGKLKPSILSALDKLIIEMEAFFKPEDLGGISKNISSLKDSNPLKQKLASFVRNYSSLTVPDPDDKLMPVISDLMLDIRKNLLADKSPRSRLKLMDISLQLEKILYKISEQRKTGDLSRFNKKELLPFASAGRFGIFRDVGVGKIKTIFNRTVFRIRDAGKINNDIGKLSESC